MCVCCRKPSAEPILLGVKLQSARHAPTCLATTQSSSPPLSWVHGVPDTLASLSFLDFTTTHRAFALAVRYVWNTLPRMSPRSMLRSLPVGCWLSTPLCNIVFLLPSLSVPLTCFVLLHSTYHHLTFRAFTCPLVYFCLLQPE